MLQVHGTARAYAKMLETAKGPLEAALASATVAAAEAGWNTPEADKQRLTAAIASAESAVEPYTEELAYLRGTTGARTPYQMISLHRRHESPVSLSAATERQAYTEALDEMWNSCSSLEFQFRRVLAPELLDGRLP